MTIRDGVLSILKKRYPYNEIYEEDAYDPFIYISVYVYGPNDLMVSLDYDTGKFTSTLDDIPVDSLDSAMKTVDKLYLYFILDEDRINDEYRFGLGYRRWSQRGLSKIFMMMQNI